MSSDPQEPMDDSDRLKPCPFCGGSASAGFVAGDGDNAGGHYISCDQCDASTGLRFSCGEDARPILSEQWNKRTASMTPFIPFWPRSSGGNREVVSAHEMQIKGHDRDSDPPPTEPPKHAFTTPLEFAGYATNNAPPTEPSAEVVLPEPFVPDWPEYHSEAMGCGLEDRGIRDRYEAMAHGWECAVERCAECVPDVYTASQVRAAILADRAARRGVGA